MLLLLLYERITNAPLYSEQELHIKKQFRVDVGGNRVKTFAPTCVKVYDNFRIFAHEVAVITSQRNSRSQFCAVGFITVAVVLYSFLKQWDGRRGFACMRPASMSTLLNPDR